MSRLSCFVSVIRLPCNVIISSATVSGNWAPFVSGNLRLRMPAVRDIRPNTVNCRLGLMLPRETMKGAMIPPTLAATLTRPMAEFRIVVGNISPL